MTNDKSRSPAKGIALSSGVGESIGMGRKEVLQETDRPFCFSSLVHPFKKAIERAEEGAFPAFSGKSYQK